MVKKMDNYAERMSDRRFEKFDRMISVEAINHEKRISYILTIGVVVLLIGLMISSVMNLGKPVPPKYDYGLNMSYDPETSTYFVDYTNPNQTASNMNVNIEVPYFNTGTSGYSSVYKTSTDTFPANISYKPYDKGIEHAITVTIMKQTGNYTYFFTSNPSDEERIYNGLTKYTKQIDKYIVVPS
jgi:hypothetical protein